MNKLSTLDRDKVSKKLSSEHFDLLVIGGGITGAGIALDAASRGLTVALVEKGDYASGTSSKSTKLIHGGLRYLKQLEIELVKEVGRERAILHKNAPHLVNSENMLLPIIEGGSLGRLTTALGLTVYDWLAGVRFSEWKSMLSKFRIRRKEPLLRQDIVKGGAIYKEYRTDDARLVIEVIKTACEYDAWCLNYVRVDELTYENKLVTGAKVFDVIGEKQFNIKARKVISAAGPWVDKIREKDGSSAGKRLHLTKGVHLVVPYEKLPVKQSAYFDVADGRMIFVIPREKSTYIGTTDTTYSEDIDHPTVTKKDATYLLDAVNNMFPTVHLTPDCITSSWAGLRPLIHEEGKSPSELSRKDEIFYSETGLISIAGGKLTGYRKMAERAVDVAVKQLEYSGLGPYKKCFTDEIPLTGGDFKDEYAFEEYEDEMAKRLSDDMSKKDISILVNKYGTNTEGILKIAEGMPGTFMESVIAAELAYSIEQEAVTNLIDFMERRTGRLYFEMPEVESFYPMLKHQIEDRLSWNKDQKDTNDQEFKALCKELTQFN